MTDSDREAAARPAGEIVVPPGSGARQAGHRLVGRGEGDLLADPGGPRFHSFIAKPFYIPSESMMPGLLKGGRLVVSKYPYGWSWGEPELSHPAALGRADLGRMPERGDVVILTPPSGPNQSQDYIKRVIGLPGDTIEVNGGVVYLNGRALPREERPRTRDPGRPQRALRHRARPWRPLRDLRGSPRPTAIAIASCRSIARTHPDP